MTRKRLLEADNPIYNGIDNGENDSTHPSKENLDRITLFRLALERRR